jgi:hypothetical protein
MGAIVGVIIFGIPSAIIARSKGFKPLRWLIAMGLIGLIVVACLSSAKAKDISEEERAARAAKANKTGATLAWISVGLSVIFTLVGLAMMNA